MMQAYAQYAGAGLEHARATDYALPFLYLLQSNSPQVDEEGERYVEGAKPGKFLNTVTNELFDSLTVIPAEFIPCCNEWVPRDDGGGFVASHPNRQVAEQKQGEGTQLVDTANHYVLSQKEDGSWEEAILSLTSTKLKASRNWLSRIAGRTIDTPQGKKVAPSFAGVYLIESIRQENDKGKFHNIQITPVEGAEGWVTDPDLFQKALSFRASVNQGMRGADYSKAGETVVEAEVDGEEPTY